MWPKCPGRCSRPGGAGTPVLRGQGALFGLPAPQFPHRQRGGDHTSLPELLRGVNEQGRVRTGAWYPESTQRMVTVTDGFVHPVSHLVFKWGHTEPRSEENPCSADGAWGAGAHAGDRGRALRSQLRRRGAEPVVPRAQAAPPVGSLLGRIGSADCHRGAAVSTRLRRGGLAQPSLDLSLRGLGPLSSRCGVRGQPSVLPSTAAESLSAAPPALPVL